jgi:signal transduction histidine kinase
MSDGAGRKFSWIVDDVDTPSEDKSRDGKRGVHRQEIVNEAQRQFLLVLTHEMRTPLSAILLWTKLLRRGPVDAKELQEGLQAIQDSAEEQRMLLDGLFEMANVASGRVRLKPQSTRLASVVRGAIEEVSPTATTRGVELRTSLSSDVGSAMVDYDHFKRALAILISNAIAFCPVPGQVGVELARNSDSIEIRITDSGRTITPAGLAHLFDPLIEAHAVSIPTVVRVRLSIAKELIALHAGTVQAHSHGRGVTFVVRVPQTNTKR